MMLMAYLEEVVEDLTNLHHNDRKKIFDNSCGYTQLLSLCVERILSFGMHKSSMWVSRNLYECIRAAAKDIPSYPAIKSDWNTVDILNLSKPGRSRAWIRHAMNQGHLGDSILAMAGNFDFADNWFHEYSIMKQAKDIKQVYEWLESLSMFHWNLNVNDRGLNNEALWTDSTPGMLRQKMKLTRVTRVFASPRASSLVSKLEGPKDIHAVGVAPKNAKRGSFEVNQKGKVLVEIFDPLERLSESYSMKKNIHSLFRRTGAVLQSMDDCKDLNMDEEVKQENPEEMMLRYSPSASKENLQQDMLRGSPSRSDEDLEVILLNPPKLELPECINHNPSVLKSQTIQSALDNSRPIGSISREVKLSLDSPPSPSRKKLQVLSKGRQKLSPLKTAIQQSPTLGSKVVKFGSFQKFVSLQTIDGEIKPGKLQGGAQLGGKKTETRKLSLDLVLEQEKEKRKKFQFPDPEKFKVEDVEDEKQEKILEKHWEKTSITGNMKTPYKPHLPEKPLEPKIQKTQTLPSNKNHKDFDSDTHFNRATGWSTKMDMKVYSAKERKMIERELLSGQRPGEQNSTRQTASTGVILQLQVKGDLQFLAKKQGNKCFTCGQVMEQPQRCDYSGMLYCKGCFFEESPIPARMLMHRDAHPRSISIASSKHLKAMWQVPCIPLSHVSDRYQHSKSFKELSRVLQRFRIQTPSGKQIDALGRKAYLLHSWDSDYQCFHELTRAACYGLLTIEDFHRVITEPEKALQEINSLLSSLN